MRYKSPPLPVDLAMVNDNRDTGDNQSIITKFEEFVDPEKISELATVLESKKGQGEAIGSDEDR